MHGFFVGKARHLNRQSHKLNACQRGVFGINQHIARQHLRVVRDFRQILHQSNGNRRRFQQLYPFGGGLFDKDFLQRRTQFVHKVVTGFGR